MKKIALSLAATFGLLLWLGCENRLPLADIEFSSALKMRLYTEAEPEVEAQRDTLQLRAELVDEDNNLLSLDGRDYSLKATTGKLSGFTYFVSDTVSDSAVDTVVMTLRYNDGVDSVSDTLIVAVTPSESSIGFLPPERMSLTVRTDSVYMDGNWQLFVDAIVSDSLGDPVKDGTPVIFSIESSTIDTSQVTLGTIVYTGDTATIDNMRDQIPGDAINVITYTSAAIGAQVVLKATVQTDSTIVARDTLFFPVPTNNLKLNISDRNGGIVEVPNGGSAIAKFEVSLQDGFNAPIPRHVVNVSSLAGKIMPSAKVYDADSNVVGSIPVEGDTLIDSEEFWSKLIDTTFFDTTYEDTSKSWELPKIDTIIVDTLIFDTSDVLDSTIHDTTINHLLDNPYSGLTNAQGTFALWIRMNANEAPADDKIKTMNVQVELEEATTHHKENEFSFPVLFNKF